MRDQRDRVSSTVATANGLATSAIARELAANTNSVRWEVTINDVDSDDFGESTGALAIYEESLNFRRRLAEIDPRNSQWQRDGAYFLDRIGDEYRNVGMNRRAIAAYEESLALWRQLAKIDWRNSQRQLDIAVCLDKLGDVKLDAADDIGALAAYEESLTTRRHLSKVDPKNSSRQLNVAESLEKIGDLKLAAGDNKGALAAYREMLSIDRRLVEIDGSNIEWQRNLSLSLERFGDVTFTVGDTIAAVALYEESVALRRRLAASGKTNTQWQKEVSSSLEKISRLKRWAIYEGMLPIDSKLAEADKPDAKQENVSIKLSSVAAKVAARELAAQKESLGLEKVGDAKHNLGDNVGAITALEESLAIRRTLAERDKDNAQRQWDVLLSLEKVGRTRLSTGDTDGGLAAFAETLAIARNLLQTDEDNFERPRDVLKNAMLGIGAVLRKFSTLSLPKLIAATRRQSRRYLRTGLVIVVNSSAQVRVFVRGLQCSAPILGKFSALLLPKLIVAARRQSRRYLRTGSVVVVKSSAQARVCVRGLQRSAPIIGKFSALLLPKLIVATRRLSRRYLRTGSVIVGTLSAQVRVWVPGLQRSAKLKGLTLQGMLPAPSSSHNSSSRYGGTDPIPKQNERIGPESGWVPLQHEGLTQGQSIVFVPIGKENTTNASSTRPIDEPQDAKGLEASRVTDSRVRMDIQTQGDQSPVNTRLGKRRRRKRKRGGPSRCLPASQKNDLDGVRMN